MKERNNDRKKERREERKSRKVKETGGQNKRKKQAPHVPVLARRSVKDRWRWRCGLCDPVMPLDDIVFLLIDLCLVFGLALGDVGWCRALSAGPAKIKDKHTRAQQKRG